MTYTVVILVLNPGPALLELTDALLAQTMPPEEILVVDSESEDGYPSQVKGKEKIRLMTISKESFDHGGTRDLALRSCNTPVVVMMTQDAKPVDDRCMEALLGPFLDPMVAAVCGRQIAREDAWPAEKAFRDFRYTDETDVWGKEDQARRGVKAFLLSDVCAAYRVSAYLEVGGFVHSIGTNEDMLIAAKLLNAGYKLAYEGKAAVFHSHNYTRKQEFERNKKIGRFLAQFGDYFKGANINGEGLRLVKYVTLTLLREGHISEVIPFWINCAAKALGNRAGKMSAKGRTRKKA